VCKKRRRHIWCLARRPNWSRCMPCQVRRDRPNHTGWRLSKRRFRRLRPCSTRSDPEARNAGLSRRLGG
jgi:hypothetical protein